MDISNSAKKVQDALKSAGIEAKVVELPDSTRTAVEAAQAIGTTVAQIVKSLVFRGQTSGKAILIEASGINRVNEKAVAAILGEPIGKADADFVREQTGYAIGGIPPLGHAHEMGAVLIDEDLLQYEELWAAAGTPHAVFRLTPDELIKIAGGKVVSIK
ncbi:MAG: YbaK/EbsC family protein [Anaerolineaceae bacterium]|nr:YbaK/EbsC family protein [Anaerolineaceae bacterium]